MPGEMPQHWPAPCPPACESSSPAWLPEGGAHGVDLQLGLVGLTQRVGGLLHIAAALPSSMATPFAPSAARWLLFKRPHCAVAVAMRCWPSANSVCALISAMRALASATAACAPRLARCTLA